MIFSQSNPERILVIGFFGGLWAFVKGIRFYREFKVIASIPRMSIGSVAMGMVHIRGRAEAEHPLSSPVSHTPCCFYKVNIEQWKSGGRSPGWTHLRTDVDGPRFYLRDDSGKALVDGHSAEIDLPQTAQRTVDSAHPAASPLGTGKAGPTDLELLQYVSHSGIHKIASFLEHWIAKSGELPDPNRERTRQGLLSILQMANSAAGEQLSPLVAAQKMMAARGPLADPAHEQQRQMALARLEQMAAAGELPMATVPAASGRYRLTEYLILPGQEYQITGACSQNQATGGQDSTIICRGTDEKTFLISSKTEAESQHSLRQKATWLILGGAAASLFCLAAFLNELNLL